MLSADFTTDYVYHAQMEPHTCVASVKPDGTVEVWSGTQWPTKSVEEAAKAAGTTPDKVKLNLTYPASTGRNFQELLRVIDSLQLTDGHKVATPVNWTPGDDVIISAALSNDDAAKLFPGGWDEKKPYLRVTKQPV